MIVVGLINCLSYSNTYDRHHLKKKGGKVRSVGSKLETNMDSQSVQPPSSYCNPPEPARGVGICEGPIGNMLGFTGHVVSVTTNQLCCCSPEGATDKGQAGR